MPDVPLVEIPDGSVGGVLASVGRASVVKYGGKAVDDFGELERRWETR